MAQTKLGSLVTRERKRLEKRHADMAAKAAKIQAELSALELELNAGSKPTKAPLSAQNLQLLLLRRHRLRLRKKSPRKSVVQRRRRLPKQRQQQHQRLLARKPLPRKRQLPGKQRPRPQLAHLSNAKHARAHVAKPLCRPSKRLVGHHAVKF